MPLHHSPACGAGYRARGGGTNPVGAGTLGGGSTTDACVTKLPIKNLERNRRSSSNELRGFFMSVAALPTTTPTPLGMDLTSINTIRTLSMDGVQAANSGHPGTPMAMAPVAYTLWQQFLRFDPQDPVWPNRDRFVLSMGHASTLLYSLLHLTGVKAVNTKYEKTGQPSGTLDDIRRFRQLDSKCPG